jgi:hypothetical protein
VSRRTILAFVLVICAACTSGPSQPQLTPRPTSGSSRPKAPPQTAEIHCTEDGVVRVITPAVAAQPDGVHFLIHNDRSARVVFHPRPLPGQVQIDFASHGDNRVAPNGVEEIIWTAPPGTLQVICSSAAGASSGTIEVLDPANLFASIDPDLQCDSRGAKTWELTAPLTGSDERFRRLREWVRGLRLTDILQRVVYVQEKHLWVRIIRNGRYVALVNFPDSLDGGVYACISSGIRSRQP